MNECSVCGRSFERRFSFQVSVIDGVTRYFCSQSCRIRADADARGDVVCATCGTAFRPVYAYQTATIDGETQHFCSMDCRAPAMEAVRRARTPTRRIAVLNQKGGTGKTTTTVNLAAGLAEAGHRTLLVDVDVQGNVGISLGVSRPPRGLAELLIDPTLRPEDCIVQAREGLDLLTGGAGLEAVEQRLVRSEVERPEQLLRRRLGGDALEEYAFVLVDCGPARTALNANALAFAENVLIPVGCDFLSLVGVRQILQTLRRINEDAANPISVLGVVPTFYDRRTRVSHEIVRSLRRYFGAKVMPPVRVNTRLREAPAHGKTIFEFDGRSRGAEDYRHLVRCIVEERWESPYPDSDPEPSEAFTLGPS